MASPSALSQISAGLNPDALNQRWVASGQSQPATLSEADVRRLLLIGAAESGDTSRLQGRRLERLGRAETILKTLRAPTGQQSWSYEMNCGRRRQSRLSCLLLSLPVLLIQPRL